MFSQILNRLSWRKKRTLLSMSICPKCKTSFTSTFTCEKCGFQGYQKNGLTYLHLQDELWKSCEKERTGWIEIHKELGLYKENEDHLYLPDGKPHLAEFYKEAKRALDQLLKLEKFNYKTALDLGAGVGWVEAYILKKYKRADLIALECVDDPFVGLGRSVAIKEFHNVGFESLIADMHNIPLQDNSVDVVFTVDALHHFTDMKKVFEEVYRVLKPGGKFYAINEAWRPDDVEDEMAFVKEHCPVEYKHGINERRPKRQEYLEMGSNLHLEVLNEKINFSAPGLLLRGIKK